MSQMYDDFKNNINNFSYWYPKVKDCGIPTPNSVWIHVPEDVMNAFFLDDPKQDEVTIQRFVEKSVMSILDGMPIQLFMKNGTFSGKFDFDGMCHIINRSVCEITYKLRALSYDSFILGTQGNTEIVFREFLTDEKPTYKIYNGMPLRPEFRTFYDFEKRQVLYTANYWDWDYCFNNIKLYNVTDELIYKAAYPQILEFYNANVDKVENMVQEHMKDVKLDGIWSVDLMWCQNKFWLIDMAIADTSAYWDPEKAKKIVIQNYD